MLASDNFKILIIILVVLAVILFPSFTPDRVVVENKANPPSVKIVESNKNQDEAGNTEIGESVATGSPDISADPQENEVDVVEIIPEPAEAQSRITVVRESMRLMPAPVDEIPPQSTDDKAKILTFSEINNLTRPALVNILCQSQTGGLQKTTTGSGVIVDRRGIILTNAHIAQEFLLIGHDAGGMQNCVIRMGSPARTLYRAEILYLPSRWVIEHGADTQFDSLEDSGDDFAFLLITEATDPARNLPSSFPSVSFDPRESIGRSPSVLIAGYPAGFIGSDSIQKDLHITSSVATIDRYITFDGETIDAITFDGNVLAQQGASGGAVIDSDNMLIAIISSLISAESTSDRVLNALTVWHIDSRVADLEGYGISKLFQGDVYGKADRFNSTTGPILSEILLNSL
jgi:S1-C subfamily serine protease